MHLSLAMHIYFIVNWPVLSALLIHLLILIADGLKTNSIKSQRILPYKYTEIYVLLAFHCLNASNLRVFIKYKEFINNRHNFVSYNYIFFVETTFKF